MENQAKTNTEQKEQQLKKLSKMSLIRSLLPVVGLVVIFLLFNVLTNFRMVGNLSLVLSQVYVTMIAATGVFFIMTMGGLDFSQGSILGIACVYAFQDQHSVSNRGRNRGRRGDRSIERLLLCIPQDQVVYRYDLYHVLIPWIYQISDHQCTRGRFRKAH